MSTESKVKFLQEWKPEHFRKMNAAIGNHFRKKEVVTEHNGRIRMRGIRQVEQILGLPFTSGSSCAALWANCNTHAYFDTDKIYYYLGFAIGEDERLYIMLQDIKENQLTIEL